MAKHKSLLRIPAFSRIATIAAVLALSLILVAVIGCGGETRGTGGGTIGGRVLDVDGITPIADAIVSDSANGNSTVTDQQGNFTLPLPEDSTSLDLEFTERDGTVSSGSVAVPDTAVSLDVEVRINRQTSQAIITVEEPIPTPFGPTATAAATPTGVPGATPTAPASATPTATATARPCAADFNHDGMLNQDDYDQFSAVFVAGDPAADFDSNSFVNGDDFDAFTAAFAAGC